MGGGAGRRGWATGCNRLSQEPAKADRDGRSTPVTREGLGEVPLRAHTRVGHRVHRGPRGKRWGGRGPDGERGVGKGLERYPCARTRKSGTRVHRGSRGGLRTGRGGGQCRRLSPDGPSTTPTPTPLRSRTDDPSVLKRGLHLSLNKSQVRGGGAHRNCVNCNRPGPPPPPLPHARP